MKVIRVRNVHQALPEALHQLRACGLKRGSRNGPVIVFPEPVTTVYERPEERVLFWPERDANPFFHLYESLWMLAGRNDVEGVAHYVNRMRSFSDDGVTFHGAYGYRWRHQFDKDQLPLIIEALKADHDDRRQVLSMWDARADLGRKGKDLPCNLQALFQVAVDGRLDMTVTNRSNDLIWGAYGANGVHFSVLHEFMARAIGVPVGVYRQVSNNLHAYVQVLEQVASLADAAKDPLTAPAARFPLCPYERGEVEPFPLMTLPWREWLGELDMFLSDPGVIGLRDPFFRRVASPILRAHAAYKEGSGEERYNTALDILSDCKATDWHAACVQWLERRWSAYLARKAKAQDDGVAYE